MSDIQMRLNGIFWLQEMRMYGVIFTRTALSHDGLNCISMFKLTLTTQLCQTAIKAHEI